MSQKTNRSDRKHASSNRSRLSVLGSSKPRQDTPKSTSDKDEVRDQDFDETDFLIRKAMDEKRGSFKKLPKPVYDSWNLPEENSIKPAPTHVGKGPRGYKRSDERIWEDVCEALSAHPEIDASEMEVEVKDGVVKFTGTVDNRLIKRMAEDLVEDISGVADIQNELHLKHVNGKRFKN
jgi:hypothetical protein